MYNKKAIALQYQMETKPAPKITAKGQGEIAERIVNIAQDHDIPIVNNASIIDLLYHKPLDSLIPIESYAVVAEVLNFIYRQKKMRK